MVYRMGNYCGFGSPLHRPGSSKQRRLGVGWNRTPICLLSEKEMADANGGRQAAGQDPRAIEFAKQMTEHFAELPKAEPIYGRLAVCLN